MSSTKTTSVIKFDPNVFDWKTTEDDGKNIYNSNEFLRSLTNIMENPEFFKIITKYFDSWDNIELFVMFTKIYESITMQFPNMNGYEKIALVKKIIDNGPSRQLVCQEIKKFRKQTSLENKTNTLN